MARTCAGGNGIDGRTPAEASTSGAARPWAVESAQAANTRTVARHAALADMERANSTTDFRVLIMDTRLRRLDVYRNVSSNSAKAGTEPRHSRAKREPSLVIPGENGNRASSFPRKRESIFYDATNISIPYAASASSDVTRVHPSTIACATSILSKGSRWYNGSASVAAACRIVTGNSVKSFSVRTFTNAPGNDSFPSLRLISASHADAALTYTISASRIALFTSLRSCGVSNCHHISTCVSRSSRTISSSALQSLHGAERGHLRRRLRTVPEHPPEVVHRSPRRSILSPPISPACEPAGHEGSMAPAELPVIRPWR